MGKVTGLNKLARDCGVSDLVPGTWVEHVKALMPGTGALARAMSWPFMRRTTLSMRNSVSRVAPFCASDLLSCSLDRVWQMRSSGFVIDRPGLFADKASGVSAKFLASKQAKDKAVSLTTTRARDAFERLRSHFTALCDMKTCGRRL